MKKEYESYNHAKCHIRYHMIFSTKYRKPCLQGIEKEVERVLQEIASHGNFRIVKVGIGVDHVHLLVRSRPSVSISSIVRRLKQVSTRMLWSCHESHLRGFYWGRKRVVWTNGYYCSTVGEMSEDIVEAYIASHHVGDSYAELKIPHLSR